MYKTGTKRISKLNFGDKNNCAIKQIKSIDLNSSVDASCEPIGRVKSNCRRPQEECNAHK